MNELKCPICGKPTRVYMGNARKDGLCGTHADMLKKEEISQDENGDWIDLKTKKNLTKKEESRETLEVEKKKDEISNSGRIIKCIACGKETKPGFFFCTSCYLKYKDKEILVRINKCVDIELLDDSYEGKFTCSDGHIVKSKSEMIIDNYLFEHKIPHAYEKALPIDGNKEHDLHPDFYLPTLDNGKGVYLEHSGYDNNIQYTKSKNYKKSKYKELGVTVICTNENDMMDYQSSLERKLKFFKSGTVNDN